jgi:hypothetical protein
VQRQTGKDPRNGRKISIFLALALQKLVEILWKKPWSRTEFSVKLQ